MEPSVVSTGVNARNPAQSGGRARRQHSLATSLAYRHGADGHARRAKTAGRRPWRTSPAVVRLVLQLLLSPQRRLGDEGDSGADVDVAVADATKAAAVEIEVHLANEEPPPRQYLLDYADMAAGAGPLDVRLEDHRRANPGRGADAQA